jgi:hypothetical protein
VKYLTVVIVMLVALFGFASPAQAAGDRTVVLGDSIIGQMCGGDHQSIPTRLVPNAADVGCYGWPGTTSGGLWRQINEPGWVDPLNSNRSTQTFDLRGAINNADTLVIGLGTNNFLRQQPVEWFGWDIDNFMRLANGRRVIWFDIGTRMAPGPTLDSAFAHNTMLWSKRAQYPNLTVLAWGGEVGSHSNYLLSDGIHLSTDGYYRRWNMVNSIV